MAKTLATSLVTDTAKRITSPGYLVELDFSTPLRLSTRGDQSYDGKIWTAGRLGEVKVSADGGQIEIMNGDLAASALILNEGATDRAISIWKFYADNPADVVQVFAGVCDSSEIGPDRVRIRLVAENRRTLYSPRRFIGQATGFNHLLPAGTRITWGGETYVLER